MNQAAAIIPPGPIPDSYLTSWFKAETHLRSKHKSSASQEVVFQGFQLADSFSDRKIITRMGIGCFTVSTFGQISHELGSRQLHTSS